MEGNGSIFPAEERWNTLGQELGPSTTFGRIPRTTLKIAILKPQVADVWFSMIGAYGWMCAAMKVVDGRNPWRVGCGNVSAYVEAM